MKEELASRFVSNMMESLEEAVADAHTDAMGYGIGFIAVDSDMSFTYKTFEQVHDISRDMKRVVSDESRERVDKLREEFKDAKTKKR